MIEKLNSIPITLLVSIFFSGLLIFLLFKLVDKYYITFSKSGAVHSMFHNVVSKVKLLVWFLWFTISLYFLLLVSPFITIVFLIGIYLFSKDFWKNIYSGIFIMNKIKEGDYIFIPSLETGGMVHELMLSDIELQKDNDELVYIPYSLIINSTLVKRDRSGKHFLNEFYLDTKNKNLLERQIKEAVIDCPWTILSKPYEINFNHLKGIQVRVYTFSKDTAAMQQEFVRRAIS